MAANIKTPCRAWSPDHATACCTTHQKSATNPAPSVRRSALTPPFTPIFLYAKNFATNYHQTYCCHKHSCKLALFLFQGPASPHRLAFPYPPHSRGLSRVLRNALHFRVRLFWCTISGRVKNSVRSACRPVRPPFCFAKPLVRLYAARGVYCSLPAFAHAQSWPLPTNPQPFLANSPRETNTSACAKCESVPEGMVRQKSRNIRCGFSWCTIGDSNPGPTD